MTNLTELRDNMFKIHRKSLFMHITATYIHEDILFFAEGNQVSLYHLFKRITICCEQVFLSSIVHGIRIAEKNKAVFYGSKSLRIYSFDCSSLNSFKSLSDEILLSDWIHDVQWINYNAPTKNYVAVITAHNCLAIFSIESKSIVKVIQCIDNCILYTASIISSHKDTLIVAVGTVFKQILIWSPNSTQETNKNKVPFHCLEGHQGVIFSVKYNEHLNILSSTSDDRSIRLWKVSFPSICETFSLQLWEKSTISLIHVLYAHESRVWTSAILPNCVLSVGEDSTLCFWSLNGKLLKQRKCHKGGRIWCLETNYCHNKTQGTLQSDSYIAITGGSDGGIYCWDINVSSVVPISQISLHKQSTDKDFPRAVYIINQNGSNKILATTDKGWLSCYDIDKKCWKDINYDPSFVSYCILSVSQYNKFIALANLNGDLVLLNSCDDLQNQAEIHKFSAHHCKIHSLFWVDKKDERLLTCGIEGNMILWEVTRHHTWSVNRIHELHLPKCKPHWWSTCALFISSTNCLIVGDRGGSINFYSLNKYSVEMPDVIHKCIHGENGVTDIKEHNSLIYSAGRDGRVLVYSISEKSLLLLHAIKISHDLEWIGKIVFYGSDLLLLGFHTKYFIVWSSELESVLMSIECGGGHRSWDFSLSEDGQALFSAIKKKDIIYAAEDLSFTLNKSVVKAGISGREFCTTCYLFTTENNEGSMEILASGGEDNAFRILGFISNNSVSSKVEVIHSLSGHLSSIRSIAKINMLEENTYLVASVGGRAQMILWKIQFNAGIKCEQLGSFVLSSAGKKVKKPWKESQSIQVDPQTRIMDVVMHHSKTSLSEKESYIIALACSDSYFRIYDFDIAERKLSLLNNIQLGEHCILTLSKLQCPKNSNENIIYIAGSTDGNATFIPLNSQIFDNTFTNSEINSSLDNVPFKVHVHQSGINAIDIQHIFENNWMICTGGDDNAISVMIIEIVSYITDSHHYKIAAKTKVNDAHASQITGVKIVGFNKIVSVSIDQRINIWHWTLEMNLLNILLETSKMSSVPDIAHLESWMNKSSAIWTLAVCGEGIEILFMEHM